MKAFTTIAATAALALAFLVTTGAQAIAQQYDEEDLDWNMAASAQTPQIQGQAVVATPQEYRVQEQVIVSAPAAVVKGSVRDHFLTFNAPVALPNVALGAGSYIFRRPVDSAGSVIQVLSADRRHVYAMLNTMPAFRAKVTSRDAMVFGEARGGSPVPIRQWFLADTSIGYTLMYPKTSGQSGLRMGD
jgi:hypothetical protein